MTESCPPCGTVLEQRTTWSPAGRRCIESNKRVKSPEPTIASRTPSIMIHGQSFRPAHSSPPQKEIVAQRPSCHFESSYHLCTFLAPATSLSILFLLETTLLRSWRLLCISVRLIRQLHLLSLNPSASCCSLCIAGDTLLDFCNRSCDFLASTMLAASLNSDMLRNAATSSAASAMGTQAGSWYASGSSSWATSVSSLQSPGASPSSLASVTDWLASKLPLLESSKYFLFMAIVIAVSTGFFLRVIGHVLDCTINSPFRQWQRPPRASLIMGNITEMQKDEPGDIQLKVSVS